MCPSVFSGLLSCYQIKTSMLPPEIFINFEHEISLFPESVGIICCFSAFYFITSLDQVVSIINNFVEREMVDYYTIPDGPKKVVRLPPELASDLHQFTLINNVAPVKVRKAVLRKVRNYFDFKYQNV